MTGSGIREPRAHARWESATWRRQALRLPKAWNPDRRDELMEAVAAFGARGARPDDASMVLLNHLDGLSALDRLALLVAAPAWDDLVRLSQRDVEALIGRGISPQAWDPTRASTTAERDHTWLAHREHAILWFWDAGYPPQMRNAFDPPPSLYVRSARHGDRIGLNETADAVAVVGTRRPDSEGLAATHRLSIEIAAAGRSVVSGLALGIDTAAHHALVGVGYGARAVVVLPTGVDAIYPRRNRDLAADVLDQGGAVVSEFPPGTPADKWRFVARNRLVAGIAGTLVLMQAPARSGSLITADIAMGYSRDVCVHESTLGWEGAAPLLAEGARVVSTVDDIGDGQLGGTPPGAAALPGAARLPDAAARSGAAIVPGATTQTESSARVTARRAVDRMVQGKLALFGPSAAPRSLEEARASRRGV